MTVAQSLPERGELSRYRNGKSRFWDGCDPFSAGCRRVPEEKVRARHQRLWSLVERAARLTDQATFYDNSTTVGPRIVARTVVGNSVGSVAWPTWAAGELARAWPRTS